MNFEMMGTVIAKNTGGDESSQPVFSTTASLEIKTATIIQDEAPLEASVPEAAAQKK